MAAAVAVAVAVEAKAKATEWVMRKQRASIISISERGAEFFKFDGALLKCKLEFFSCKWLVFLKREMERL